MTRLTTRVPIDEPTGPQCAFASFVCAGRNRTMRLKLATLTATFSLAFSFALPSPVAMAIEWSDGRLAVRQPPEIRSWFRNPDGSCVQCSNGMMGASQNSPEFTTLLWTTEYGPAERGGSGPSRVARYARERKIPIYNVTGSTTIDMMKWACRNGRGAAIGAGSAHFQSLFGYDPSTDTWWVCNNNSTGRIDEYSDEAFRRLHRASGPWIVIIDRPPQPPTPIYAAWWN